MVFRIKQMLLCGGVVVLFVGLMELVERSSSHYRLDFYPQAHIMRYATGAVIHWGREGYGTTTIGPEGMIGNKSPDGPGTRVMFLGDSFTEALQVDDAEKFTELVQTNYNRQSPQNPLTTLNFAFSGQSAVQYAADLPGLSRRWQPQIVIVQLSPFDFAESDVTLRTNNQTARLVTSADGQWTLENALPPAPASRKQQITRKLADWHLFSTLARISWRMNQFFSNAAPPETNETAQPTANAAATVANNNAQETQYQARVKWLLNQLRETCEANGARLVVLYAPHAPQLQAGRVWYDESWLGAEYLRQRAILAETCAAQRVPFWNPLPALNDFAQQTGRLPFGFANNTPGQGHLNPDGHRVLADFLTAQLSAQ